jgi:hypothetical protein
MSIQDWKAIGEVRRPTKKVRPGTGSACRWAGRDSLRVRPACNVAVQALGQQLLLNHDHYDERGLLLAPAGSYTQKTPAIVR